MAILVCVCPQGVMEPLSDRNALTGLPSMIKLYSRFSIYCQCCECSLKIHFPINLWFFSRLFQFSFLTFTVESRMGIHPPERAWPAEGWLGEKGVWGCYTKSSGIRTRWAGLFSCAREGGILKEPVKQTQESLLTLPGTRVLVKHPPSGCLLVATISWPLEPGPGWLYTHVSMTVWMTKAKWLTICLWENRQWFMANLRICETLVSISTNSLVTWNAPISHVKDRNAKSQLGKWKPEPNNLRKHKKRCKYLVLSSEKDHISTR